MTLRLRPYNDNDAETILSWSKDAESYYRWCAGIPGEYPITTEQFHFVTKHMAFTAVEDEMITGFFTLRKPSDDPDALRFGFVIVNPEKRGQRYGKRILMEGIHYAKEICGAKKVTLGVFENNPSAYHCYRSIGFTDSGKTVTYTIQGKEWNCIEMEMFL